LYTFLVPFFACSLSGDTKTKQTLEEAAVVKGDVACFAVPYWPHISPDEPKVLNTRLNYLLLLLFITFVQGTYNYMPATKQDMF